MDVSDFPLNEFRALRKQFAAVSDADVIIHAESALSYFSPCCTKHTKELWTLVVAHMLDLDNKIANGESPTGVVTSVSEDKISLSFSSPPAGSDWSHWFKMTTYGQQFLALIKRCSVPRYFGGRGERTAFRGVGGNFVRGGRLR